MDRSLIETYVAGPAKRRAACAGLTRNELTARPGPGAWSILEVVVHLADSDAISIDRMKRMLTEDSPPLLYLRGEIRPEDRQAVGIVGSRQCTSYGRRMAERLAAGLVPIVADRTSTAVVVFPAAAHGYCHFVE